MKIFTYDQAGNDGDMITKKPCQTKKQKEKMKRKEKERKNKRARKLWDVPIFKWARSNLQNDVLASYYRAAVLPDVNFV